MTAIEDSIAAGRSINVTLVFSVERYVAAARAYQEGLTRFRASGGDLSRVHSVASFFVSRVDSETDRRLDALGAPAELHGKLGIANAKLAYARYRELFSPDNELWGELSAAGAHPQRCLWASTSTKNPAYRDVLYVEELIGPDTVNTMPEPTLLAFQDHGRVARDARRRESTRRNGCSSGWPRSASTTTTWSRRSRRRGSRSSAQRSRSCSPDWRTSGAYWTWRERGDDASSGRSRGEAGLMARAKPTPSAPEQHLPREQLVEFLAEMLLIRRFEEKVEERFRAGELAGFLHVCIGQEAVAVGVCRALQDGDLIGSTHRAHGHVLANGTPPNEVMAELYGKVEGCSHGYGGSMHLYDVARGNMGANAVVGGGLPGMAGAALAFQTAPRAARRRRVLRRRRHQHRHLPRVDEPRPALAAAGRVRLREQPLVGVDAPVAAPADPRPNPPRAGLRDACAARGRPRRRGGPPRRP